MAKIKKIYWVKKDIFNNVEYDEIIKNIKEIDEVICIAKFSRWEKNIETYKWERITKTTLFEKMKTEKRNNTEIVFLKTYGGDK